MLRVLCILHVSSLSVGFVLTYIIRVLLQFNSKLKTFWMLSCIIYCYADNKVFYQKGNKVYCALLDASKAFDKVLHNVRYVKLLKKGVSVRFVRILQNWYSKLCAAVQ